MVVDADGAVSASDIYRAVVLNRAKLAYNAVAAWLDGAAPAPPRDRAVPDSTSNSGCRTGSRSSEAAAAAPARRAEPGDASRRGPCSTSDALADLRPEEKNRAKRADRRLHDRGERRDGAVPRAARSLPSLRRVLRSPERWERIVALAPESRRAAARGARRPALERFPRQAPRTPIRQRFPDLSLSVIKLLGRANTSSSCPASGSKGISVSP